MLRKRDIEPQRGGMRERERQEVRREYFSSALVLEYLHLAACLLFSTRHTKADSASHLLSQRHSSWHLRNESAKRWDSG